MAPSQTKIAKVKAFAPIRSFDQIVANFSKTITQLDNLVMRKSFFIDRSFGALASMQRNIEGLERTIEAASDEINKAERFQENLKKLIGTS